MRTVIITLMAFLLSGCSFFSTLNYETSDHTFNNQGLKFEGTLYRPKSSPPYPLAVIAHGAGDSKRTFSLYKYFAEYLSVRGIAVFVFDKRGVGGSEGIFTEEALYLDTLGGDMAAAFNFASRLPEIDTKRSGLLGISQAGWTMPLALQSIDTIAFIVNISGPSVPPYYSDAFYRANELRNDGFAEQEIEEITEYSRTISRYVGTFDDREAALNAKKRFKDKQWFKELKFSPNLSPDDTLRLPKYDHYRRSAFDPAKYWNRSSLPVLCLFGDKDSHIPVDTIARRFEQIFSAAQFSDYTIKRFPNGGHILQQVDGEREKTGHDPISMLFKGFPDPTEESIAYIEQWIKQRVK